MIEEEAHRLVHRRVVDHVVVVERDHQRTGVDVEVVDQAGQHLLRREPAIGVHERQGLGSGLRQRGLDRGHEVGEELPQVGVRGVEGQPRHAPRLARRSVAA